MKIAGMAKRVVLFLTVNLLVLLTLSLVLSLLGVNHRLGSRNYQTLLIFCFAYGMIGAFVSLALSRLMAKWMVGVQVIPPDAPDASARILVQTVHELAQRAGLPVMPEVGVYNSPDPNAFATGPTRSRALVAVSTGLLQQMDRREIRGVLAHEIAHIANGDMVTMTLIQGVINAFVMFFARIAAFAVANLLRRGDDEDDSPSFFLHYALIMVFEIVFSLLGAIVTCWFSRWREYRADAGGAEYGGRENMIAALRALQELSARMRPAPKQAGAFDTLKIHGQGGGLLRLLFSTHPPLANRIAALERIS